MNDNVLRCVKNKSGLRNGGVMIFTLRCPNRMVTHHGTGVSTSLLEITSRIALMTYEIMARMARNVSYMVKKTFGICRPRYARELGPFDFV